MLDYLLHPWPCEFVLFRGTLLWDYKSPRCRLHPPPPPHNTHEDISRTLDIFVCPARRKKRRTRRQSAFRLLFLNDFESSRNTIRSVPHWVDAAAAAAPTGTLLLLVTLAEFICSHQKPVSGSKKCLALQFVMSVRTTEIAFSDSHSCTGSLSPNRHPPPLAHPWAKP